KSQMKRDHWRGPHPNPPPRAGEGREGMGGGRVTRVCAGRNTTANGISTQSANADVHNKCPKAADCRRSAIDSMPATAMSRLVLSAMPRTVMTSGISASLLACGVDQRADLVELRLRQLFPM